MGWGRYLFLGDLGQQLDIMDQQKELDRLRSTVTTAHDVGPDWGLILDRLRRENDELKLYLAAIIRLLKTKEVVTQEEIASIVNQLDAEDGTTDGRLGGNIN